MNIGIVGCGNVAKAHLTALESIEIIAKIFVFDIDFGKAQVLAEGCGKTKLVEKLKTLSKEVDGVIICTPNNTHLAVIKEILSYRAIPILCEKPLASTLNDANEIKHLLTPKSIMGFNYRFNPIVASILEVKALRNLGDCIFIDVAFNKKSAIVRKHPTWRDGSDQNKSSGAFGDLSCHLLDLVAVIANSKIKKDSVRVSCGTRVPYKSGIKIETDDHCIVAGATENHSIFKIKASKAADDKELGFYVNVVFEHGEVHYSAAYAGVLELDLINSLQKEIISIEHQKLLQDPAGEIEFWSDSFYLQDKNWIGLLSVKNEPALASIDDGLDVQYLLSR